MSFNPDVCHNASTNAHEDCREHRAESEATSTTVLSLAYHHSPHSSNQTPSEPTEPAHQVVSAHDNDGHEDMESHEHTSTRYSDSDAWANSRYQSICSDAMSIQSFHTAQSQLSHMRDIDASEGSNLTPWQRFLQSKNLLLSKFDETNWSGRGQHVEFGPDEQQTIDNILARHGVLGHSATALVEKVRCKRIMLARKSIRCNWRLKREDAIEEVAHLQRLKYAHVVRCVGTYVFGKELSILLYPATAYNLETFLDQYTDLAEREPLVTSNARTIYHMRTAISKFFKCLTGAISYIHEQRVKHMDIKPANLLIQETRHESPHMTEYKIYLADFGIAKSYSTLSDAETDSRTSFTRAYAAPEVVRQEMRGLSADIFSLGCVYLEMLAVLVRRRHKIMAIRERNPNRDASYQANAEAIRQEELSTNEFHYRNYDRLNKYVHGYDAIRVMLEGDPSQRPTAKQLRTHLGSVNPCCSKGPEPFKAVKSSRTAESGMGVLLE
jgi:tRNA A-37 threonylcarbamoyl transferase component Bud32